MSVHTAADCVSMPLRLRNGTPSRVRRSSPSAAPRQRYAHWSFCRLWCRAVKQRAEYASGTRPQASTSVSTPAGAARESAASATPESSGGLTQRVAPSRARISSARGPNTLSVDPATKPPVAPRAASRRTAPMSLASTRKRSCATIRRVRRRSASDSMSGSVDSTTSMPLPASSSAISSQSVKRSSLRRVQTVSPR